MATHSSTLAWKIPWTEEPGRLQSMGSQRVGHDWATNPCYYYWVQKAPDEDDSCPISLLLPFPCGSAGKEAACNVGDLGSISGLGRSPGEGKSYPLQYSGLENSMECVVHGVAKSRTRLSDFHFPSIIRWPTAIMRQRLTSLPILLQGNGCLFHKTEGVSQGTPLVQFPKQPH